MSEQEWRVLDGEGKELGPYSFQDLQAYYTETITFRDKIDDFEKIGAWFWEETKAGRLILCLEAVSLKSENRVLRQIVDMSLITPRFWSEGPLPGTSGSGW